MNIPVVFTKHPIRIVHPNGAIANYPQGFHFPADDPYVRSHPEEFSTDSRYGMHFTVEPRGWDAPVEDDSPTETATATPGEKRSRPVRF